jgi:hypothetical protein
MDEIYYSIVLDDVVEFACNDESVLLETPVTTANNEFPSWIFNIPKTEYPTVKKCPGVINLYRHGYILRAWTDIEIYIQPNGYYEWKCQDGKTVMGTHIKEQYPGFLDDHVHIKIRSPWMVKSLNNQKILALEPTWSYPSIPFKIIPGIANISKEFTTTNPQMFFLLKPEPYKVEIKKGDPLLHFILI